MTVIPSIYGGRIYFQPQVPQYGGRAGGINWCFEQRVFVDITPAVHIAAANPTAARKGTLYKAVRKGNHSAVVEEGFATVIILVVPEDAVSAIVEVMLINPKGVPA